MIKYARASLAESFDSYTFGRRDICRRKNFEIDVLNSLLVSSITDNVRWGEEGEEQQRKREMIIFAGRLRRYKVKVNADTLKSHRYHTTKKDVIHSLLRNPVIFNPIRKPRYPIVLCHGMCAYLDTTHASNTPQACTVSMCGLLPAYPSCSCITGLI